jgi:tetrapyrrole methylase family protein/MazG family protein
MTAEAVEAVASVPVRWLRTSRHPSASAVSGAGSFDYLYETADSVEDVYLGIVEALVASATQEQRVVYAVPGSPAVAERTVELLRADPRVSTVVLPGVSFADLAFSRLGIDPLAAGARLVDGHRFAVEAAGSRGPLLVGQCDSQAVLSEVKLAIGAVVDMLAKVDGGSLPVHEGPDQLDGAQFRAQGGPARLDGGPVGTEPNGGPVQVRAQGGPARPNGGPVEVTVLQRLGLPDESVRTLAWYDLDREVEPDHLTSVWVPVLGQPFAPELVRLEELVRALRERCPWDREQTHQSLTRYLLEESYEVLEAIEELGPDGAGYEHLEEELGDVLFQVVFHSALAAEQGQFALADVARRAHDKLVGRHPHVFGNVVAETPDAVMKNWEQIKKKEKGQAGIMDEVPRNLPALLYAHKIQRKAASVGFDWDSADGARAKVLEELGELDAAIAAAGAAASGVAASAGGDGGVAASAAGDGAAGDGALGDGAGKGLEGQPGATAVRDELGDLLFAVVNVARHLRTDPEAALREATAKFRRRFQAVEALVAARGQDMAQMSLAQLDELWGEVKSVEAGKVP